MKPFNYRSMLRSAARKIWMWSPDRRQAIRNARIKPATLACASCKKEMRENPRNGLKKEYRVDHIIPASEPASAIKSWDDFYTRMFECGPNGMQILCKTCHDQKTKAENVIRRRSKTKKKTRRKVKGHNSNGKKEIL